MKAIQVRVLPATNTKPTRLKVMAEGVKAIIECVDSFDHNHAFKSIEQQAAELMANEHKWLKYQSWTESERVLRGGQIPNGDHVFVIVAIPFDVRKSFIEFKGQ